MINGMITISRIGMSLGAVGLLLSSSTIAADVTFVDTQNSNSWQDSANWVGGSVPSADIGGSILIQSGFDTGGDPAIPITGIDNDYHNIDTLRFIIAGVDNTYDLQGTGSLTFNSGGIIYNYKSATNNISVDKIIGSSGTLTFDAANGSLGINGAVDLSAGTALTVTGSNGTEISGIISGDTGSLTKTGSGTLVLNSSNTYSGGTTLSGGTIDINTDNAFGDSAGAITVAGDTLLDIGPWTEDIRTIDNAINLNDGQVLSVTGSNTMNLNGDITGDGSIYLDNYGDFYISGNNSFTGGITVAGSDIRTASATALGTGAVTITGASSGLTIDGSGNDFSNVFILNTELTVYIPSGPNTLSGEISGNGKLKKVGEKTLTITHDNSSFSGNTQIGEGAIQVSHNNAFGTGTLIVDKFVSFASAPTLTAGANDISLANDVTLVDTDLTISGTHDLTLAGSIGGAGARGLIKEDSGTLTLSGTNTYSGDTTINEGTIIAEGGNAIGDSSLVIIADVAGATLQLNGDETIGGLTGGGSTGGELILQDNTLTIGGDDDTTFDGVISGTGALAITGTGTLALTGTNTFTGGTTLNGGVTTVSSDDAFGTGSVTVAGASGLTAGISSVTLDNVFTLNNDLTISGDNDLTLDDVIDGTGALIKTGIGTLTLNGTNTYSGGTTLLGGGLTVGSDDAIGSGSLTVSGVATLTADSSVTLDNPIVFEKIGLTFGLDIKNDHDLTLNGVISGPNGFGKDGSGMLILNGENTFTGNITAIAGGITVGSNNALGTDWLSVGGLIELTAGISDVTLSNSLHLGNGNVLTISGDNNLTFESGVLTGYGQIEKTGAGTLSLGFDESDSYGGDFNILEGTVIVFDGRGIGNHGTVILADVASAIFQLDDDETIGSLAGGGSIGGVVNLQGNTLTVTSPSDATFDGLITGTGSLLINRGRLNKGTQTLSGDNTYIGGTTLDSGVLQVSHNNALGTGALTVDTTPINTSPPTVLTASLLAGIDGVAIANDIILETELQVIGSNDLTLDGAISGEGGLNKTDGDYTLTLTGTNTYSGGTNIDAGMVIASGGNAIGDTGTVTFADVAGATLQLNANETIGSLVGGGSTGGEVVLQSYTLTVNGTDDTTFEGLVSGTGGLIKQGSGMLTLNGTNTYTGGTTLSAGGITVGNDDAISIGTLTVDGVSELSAGISSVTLGNAVTLDDDLIISGDNDLTITDVISGTGALIKEGAGTLTLNGINTYSGGTTLSGGGVTLGTNSALSTGAIAVDGASELSAGISSITLSNAITLSDELTISGDNNLTLGGVIDGTGALAKTGDGMLTLSGTNTYSGGTTISGGTIHVENYNSAFGDSGGVITFEGDATFEHVGNRLIYNDIDLDSHELTIDTGLLSLGGDISGTGGRILVEKGSVSLHGDNTFTGGVTANGGNIFVAHNNGLGLGTLTIAVNTTSGTDASLRPYGDIELGNAIVLNDFLEIEHYEDLILNGAISGDGSLELTGRFGLFTLNGDSTFSGGTTLEAGGITVGHNNALGTGALTVGLLMPDPIYLIAGGSSITLANTITLYDDLTVSGDNDLTLTGVIFSGDILIENALFKEGAGTLTLNGANTYTGGTTLSAGGLTVGNDDALGTGSLTVDGVSELSAGASSVTLGNAVTLNDDLTISGANDLTLDGVISDGASIGSLTKTGSGTLTLSGANTYSGGTTIDGGTVSVEHYDSAFSTGALTFTNDATLTFTAIKNINNDIDLGNHQMTITGDRIGVTRLYGTISGTDGSILIEDRYVELRGDNTFSGGVTLNAGAALLNHSNGLGLGTLTVAKNTASVTSHSLFQNSFIMTIDNAIVLNDILEIITYFDLTFDGVISGDGSLVRTGGGSTTSITLNGDNSLYSGVTELLNGGIIVGHNNALGTGALEVGASNSSQSLFLKAGVSSVTLGNAVILNDDLTISGDNNLTLTDVISGTGALIKEGNGALTLTGTNTYSGGTTISAGTLQIGDGGTTGSILGDVLNNGTLAFNRSDDLIYTGVISESSGSSGSFVKAGDGTLTLTGTNTYSGLTTIMGGTLQIGDGGTTGSIQSSILNNATLAFNRSDDLTYSNLILGIGSLVKEGSGTLTLSGTNTYSGGTNINAGTVVVSGGNAISDSGTVTLADVSGATLQLNADETIGSLAGGGSTGGEVSLQSYTLTIGDANDTIFGGTIAGTGYFTKVGAGTLTLSGSNTYSGGMTLSAGGIAVGNDNAIGTGSLTVDGASDLSAGASSISLANAFTLNDDLTVTGDNDLTLDGVISGTSGLIKEGVGTLTLSSTNTYSGGTTLSAGGITVGNDDAIGTGSLTVSGVSELSAGISSVTLGNAVTLNDDLTITGDNDLTLDGVISGTSGLTKEGISTLTLTGQNTYSGGTTLSGGAVIAGSDSAFGDSADAISVTANTSLESDDDARTLDNDFTIDLNSILTVSGAYDLLISGDINGAGGLTKEGDSTLVLSGHNTYTGATLVSGGILQVMNDDALGDGTLTILGSAELIVADIVTDLDNDIAIDPGQTFTVGELGDMTLSGVISGDGSLLKVGSGTLTLSGTNTYTGDTTISDGIIDITGNSSAFGGADANGNYGTVTFTGDGAILTSATVTVANDINLNDHTVTMENTSGNLNLTGDISGTGRLVLDALSDGGVMSSIDLRGDNSSFTGDVEVEGVFWAYTSTAFGSGTLSTVGHTDLVAGSDITLNNDIAFNSSSGIVLYVNNDMTLNGEISGYGDLVINGDGSDTLTLNGANTYSKDTVINDGSIVVIGSDSAFGNTSSITLNGAVSLLSGVDDEDGVWVANAFTMSEDSTLTVDGDLDLTLNANIFDDGDVISEFGNITTNVGNGRLIKKGGGTLYLNGFNLYSGGTEIHGGTVVLLGGRDSGQMGNRLGFGTVELMGDAEIRSGEKQSSEVVNIYNDIDLDSYTLTTSTDETILRFYGSISGDGGSIVHNGPLRLVLDADNTFTGGVTMNGGTLYVYTDTGLGTGVLTINSASRMSSYFKNLTLDNDIVLNADLELDYYSSYMNLTGVISGDGALTQDSSNDVTLTLSGDNSYTGGTTFDAGILQVSHDNALGTGTFTVDTTPISGLPGDPPATASLRAGVDDDDGIIAIANDIVLETELQVIGSNDMTLGGDISGVSGLNKTDGDHTLTLSGTNTYSGDTTINAGMIIAENGNAIGDSSLVTIADVAGAILQLNGDETIGGLTGGGTTGGEVNLQANTLTIGGDTTFDGVISGTGSLAITGTGTLTLGGANTFTGGTTLNGGVTTVNSDGALGTGSVTVAGASGLIAGVSSVTLANTVTLNDTLTISGDNDLTLNGNISGTSGLTKTGDGMLVLNGYNTYSGDTTLSGGAVIAGSDSAFGDSAGAISVTANTSLESDHDDRTLDNDFTIDLNSILTVSGTFDLLLTGDIDGEGGLTKEGDGTLTLSGNNTYTGATLVSGGILQVMNDDALGNGTLTILGSAELIVADIVTDLDNDIAIDLSQTFTVGELGDMTLSGVISGDGGLLKVGSGTLTLTNDNTYSGGTMLSAGGITVGRDDAIGIGTLTVSGASELSAGISSVTLGNAVTLNDDLTITGDNDLTLDGNISGTSGLVKNDSGTLTLSGSNTYSGGTTLSVGGITIGSDNAISTGSLTVSGVSELSAGISSVTLANAVTLNDDLTITGDNDLTLDGVISGTSGLTKEGISTLTLTGQNTYSGGTDINEGTVVASGGNAIIDSGTVTLADVDGATLQLDADETIGSLVGGGSTGGEVSLQSNTLTVGDENDATYAGVISGTGDFIKEGSGTLVLSHNDNTYTGDTTVNEGILIINGNMASANMNVANGAMLAGVMSLAGNYNNAGRMSPGNSPGTMAIGGNLTLTGTSVYDMEIESTAGAGVGNDLIDVDGTADVDGTLNVIGLPGYTPTDGDTFTILESDGGVSGTFSSIFENLGSFNVKAIYNANDIMIELIGVSFTEVVTDPRLASAAEAFAQIATNDPTGDIADVIDQLQGLTDAQLVAAFEQLVPHYLVPQAQATFKGIDVQNNNFNGRLNELRYGRPKLWSNNLQVQTPQASTAEESADPEVAINFAMQVQETLEQQQETERLSGTTEETSSPEEEIGGVEKEIRRAGKDRWGGWVNGFGTFGDFDSQESQAGFEFNTGGVTLGFDYRVLDTLAAGAFLGYSNTGITVDNGLGTSSFNSINTGMYMTWFNDEGFYASGLFGGGVNFYENNRRIRFGAVDRVAESDPTGFYLQTLATGGYEFKKGNWGIGPQLALQWVNLQIGSHSETGAEDLNLDVGAFNGNSFVTRLGFRATYEYDTAEMLFVPELVGSWEHEYLDPIDTVNVGMPAGGESFSYTGLGTGRDSGLIGVNLVGISHKAPISFTVQYNTEFTPDDFIVSNIYAGVRISF
ncbi:autotransporter-associated beta strand repeat-containing protein [Planctomycetota bacterium]|nr:autotransporter-associated beta strand repeat-containing protein [Planctomycetota bacterium]